MSSVFLIIPFSLRNLICFSPSPSIFSASLEQSEKFYIQFVPHKNQSLCNEAPLLFLSLLVFDYNLDTLMEK